jgi:anti-sigma factor RsiW
MMTCHTIDPLITPFVDGELDDADHRAVDDHLRKCPPCCQRVAAERAVRSLIHGHKAALHATSAPESLRARCAEYATADRSPKGLRHIPNSDASQKVAQGFSPVSWRSRIAPFALAASLVVIVGGAFLYQATDKSARVLAAELAADHVKCFAMNRAFGTRQAVAAVESSMAASFGWRAHLPEDPASADLELVGARPCLYGEGKIAHIMYRHKGKALSLFMLPNTARTQELVEVLGHEAAIWCVGNRTFVLVTREPRAEVQRLASFVRAGLQ